jgi:hypothetical protein
MDNVKARKVTIAEIVELLADDRAFRIEFLSSPETALANHSLSMNGLDLNRLVDTINKVLPDPEDGFDKELVLATTSGF